MNTQEYLDRVLEIIRECFRPTDASESMPVATAAYLVKQKLGLDHTTFGFAKFKDVLGDLEGRGLLRTGTNTKKAFAIWLSSRLTPTDGASKYVRPTNTPFRPLRNQVWFAFVSESPPGHRFLHRVSGDVQVGLQEAPSPDWVEIVPIDPLSEKEEASRFLISYQLEGSDDLRRALSSDKWYVDFPAALMKLDRQISNDWKRRRSTRIMTLIEKWRSDNNVDDRLLFERQRPTSWSQNDLRQPSDLRQCLLSAIQQMPTEKLLDLNIPSRLLISEIRPDLLDN